MGEWERKANAKPHQQRTDLAIGVAQVGVSSENEDLFVLCIRTSEDVTVPYGATVRLLDRNRERVEVFLVGRKVAEVCDEDTRILRGRYAIAARAGSSLGGQNVSAHGGNEFTVRVDR